MVSPLLAVFAHPDDESFGVGGTLACYAASGTPVTLVTATRGEQSTLGSSGFRTLEEFGACREAELRRAVAVLGIRDLHILGHPDGGLGGLPDGLLAAEVGAVIAEVRPQIVVTFDVGGVTGHPDHIAIARATTEAFLAAAPQPGVLPARSRLFYWILPSSLAQAIEPLTGPCWQAVSDPLVSAVVDTAAYLECQRSAIACHRSQSAPPPVPLTARLAAQRGHEYFSLAAVTEPGDKVSPYDLFG